MRATKQVALSELDHFDRSARFDLLRFPEDSAERFIDPKGNIRVTHVDLDWFRLGEK